MRRSSPALLALLALLATACKKTDGRRIGTDSVFTGSVDTSLLKKTTTQYATTDGDLSSIDTTFYRWTYDGKGRTVSGVATKTNGSYDSEISVYSENPETIVTRGYWLQSIRSEMTQTFYRTGDRLDSVTTKGYHASGLSATATDQVTYYSYDADLHDTLEKNIERITGTPATQYILHRIYTSGALDSTIEEVPPQNGRLISHYGNGAIIEAHSFVNGYPMYTDRYTYFNIPSGGYYDFKGSPNLLLEHAHSYSASGVSISVQHFAYQLDQKNRVIQMSSSYIPQFQDVTEIYTY